MTNKNHTSVCLSLALSSLLLFASCRRNSFDPYHSDSGLVAGGDYRATAVQYEGPFRMFTQAGEVNNQVAIGAYTALHPDLLEIPFVPDTASFLQIIASQSHMVWHNGQNYYAMVEKGTFDMQQLDTSVGGGTNPGRNIDLLFAIEQSYDSLMHELLEMNGSYNILERTGIDSYKNYYSFHFVGSFASAEVVLPYTFLATRMKAANYLFALKLNPQPQVSAGDTVLVREGSVAFRKH